MSFVGFIQRFVADVATWYVSNDNIGALLGATALTEDANLESLNQGLRLSQPLNCDESALPHLSRDRGITLYPTEPTDSKRQRLSQWWQLHRQGGTHQGGLRNLAPYFLPLAPLMRDVHQDGAGGRATWHTLVDGETYELHKEEPSNWDWDGVPAKWSRWWRVIYYEAGFPWPALGGWGVDDGTWGDGAVWGDGPSAEQRADIIAAARERKGAHSMPWGLAICHDPAGLDPAAQPTTDADGWTTHAEGNWGASIDHDTGIPSRPPYLAFVHNKGQG